MKLVPAKKLGPPPPLSVPAGEADADSDGTYESVSDYGGRSDSDTDFDIDEVDAPEARLPRLRKLGQPWAPFSVHPIFKTDLETGTKCHVSWGAICRLHCDVGSDIVCKKQLSGSSDLVRRQICHWLILGHSITGPRARGDHVDIAPKEMDTPSWDERVGQRVNLFGS